MSKRYLHVILRIDRESHMHTHLLEMAEKFKILGEWYFCSGPQKSTKNSPEKFTAKPPFDKSQKLHSNIIF